MLKPCSSSTCGHGPVGLPAPTRLHAARPQRSPRPRLEHLAALGPCEPAPNDAVPIAAAGLAVLGAAALPYAAEALTQYLSPRKCRCCYGAGYLPCSTCHGRGKVGGCLAGLELRRCDTCGARGRVRCEPCRHTGLANHWLWSPAEDPGWGARGS
ncbi:hypothetical protein PLESTB_000999800 [Pleodorina starrii]|uniref:Uncharacterized protein n=1 Tax=Pleodorina starrii TaxID=330485 RepID=A0A9W6BP47_9CHLO|nr:hypothetical protein PLESTM_001858800 [Pleodorina starrii]GLC55553.1 hypothetical protein PLESTB_000999800 [Pleodorina starrii]GLC76434.1 hypothetical protein PLESTF_001780100 [Pleodorina starrii]